MSRGGMLLDPEASGMQAPAALVALELMRTGRRGGVVAGYEDRDGRSTLWLVVAVAGGTKAELVEALRDAARVAGGMSDEPPVHVGPRPMVAPRFSVGDTIERRESGVRFVVDRAPTKKTPVLTMYDLEQVYVLRDEGGAPCWWVERDLCSRCAEAGEGGGA